MKLILHPRVSETVTINVKKVEVEGEMMKYTRTNGQEEILFMDGIISSFEIIE